VSRIVVKLRTALAQRRAALEERILNGHLDHDTYLRLCGERRALAVADTEIEDLVRAAQQEEEEDN